MVSLYLKKHSCNIFTRIHFALKRATIIFRNRLPFEKFVGIEFSPYDIEFASRNTSIITRNHKRDRSC